jgi:hypothetical protein
LAAAARINGVIFRIDALGPAFDARTCTRQRADHLHVGGTRGVPERSIPIGVRGFYRPFASNTAGIEIARVRCRNRKCGTAA